MVWLHFSWVSYHQTGCSLASGFAIGRRIVAAASRINFRYTTIIKAFLRNHFDYTAGLQFKTNFAAKDSDFPEIVTKTVD